MFLYCMSVYFPFRPFPAFVFVCFLLFSSSKLLPPIQLSSDEKTFNAFVKKKKKKKNAFNVDCWHMQFRYDAHFLFVFLMFAGLMATD